MAIVQSLRLGTADGWPGPDYLHRTGTPTALLGGVWSRCVPLQGTYPRSRGNLYTYQIRGSNWDVVAITHNIDTGNAEGDPVQRCQLNTMLGCVSDSGTYAPGGDFDYTFLNFILPDGETYTEVSEAEADGWWATWVQVIAGASGITLRMWGQLGRDGTMYKAPDATWTLSELRTALIAGGMPTAEANAYTPSAPESFSLMEQGAWYDATETRYGYLTHAKLYDESSEPSIATLSARSLDSDADTSAWADYAMEWDSSAQYADRSGNGRELTLPSGGVLYQGLDFDDGSASEPESVEESSSAADVQSAVRATQAAESESASALESSSVTRTTGSETPESSVLSDAQEAQATRVATAQEAASPNDASAVTKYASASIGESVSASESQSAVKIAVAATAESSTSEDTSNATAEGEQLVAETSTATDSCSAVVLRVASVSETTTAEEAQDAEIEGESLVSESAVASDVCSAVCIRYASRSETVTATSREWTVSASQSAPAYQTITMTAENRMIVLSAESRVVILTAEGWGV